MSRSQVQSRIAVKCPRIADHPSAHWEGWIQKMCVYSTLH
uniref:Uncharacterized protein n=1 Tax=Rhizophora mucronata TaxID=61149 RepID=A0A2P2Q2N2_RHIMU